MDSVGDGAEPEPTNHREGNLAEHLTGVAGHHGRAKDPVGSRLHVNFDEPVGLAVEDRAVNFRNKRLRKSRKWREVIRRPIKEKVKTALDRSSVS